MRKRTLMGQGERESGQEYVRIKTRDEPLLNRCIDEPYVYRLPRHSCHVARVTEYCPRIIGKFKITHLWLIQRSAYQTLILAV